jgi:hypothetical protein
MIPAALEMPFWSARCRVNWMRLLAAAVCVLAAVVSFVRYRRTKDPGQLILGAGFLVAGGVLAYLSVV